MAAKKPAAKATKVKKTVARKAAPVKKTAPVKKAAARSKSEPARPAKPVAKATAKPVAKPAAKPAARAAATPTKLPTKLPSAAQVATATKPAVKPSTAAAPPKVQMLRPVVPRSIESADPTSGNDDDGDSPELSRNLLAGPRNVKPYIARRGEQYMGKEQLEHFRHILETWKRDLMQEVDRTVLHMKDEAANFPDPNDRATQESEFRDRKSVV